MKEAEIHPEVREKLDRIAEVLDDTETESWRRHVREDPMRAERDCIPDFSWLRQ